MRACGGSWKSSYDGWWRIEFGYGSGGSRHTKERERGSQLPPPILSRARPKRQEEEEEESC